MLRNLMTELIGVVLAARSAATPSASSVDADLVDDLVAANRILAAEGVLDGFGRVSARHDKDPGRFWLARSMAPALVTAADVMEFDLDGNAVDARGRTAYLERFIHSEIYRADPEVQAVVHSHSPAVIPFGVVGVALRPIFHLGGFRNVVGRLAATDRGQPRWCFPVGQVRGSGSAPRRWWLNHHHVVGCRSQGISRRELAFPHIDA